MDSDGRFRRGCVALFVATLLVGLAGNGGVPLWDRDEPRYAQASVQMLRRGDFVVPYYLTFEQSGDPDRPDGRYHKPPVVHWFQCASLKLLGTDIQGDLAPGSFEFAVRLPSAICSAFSLVLLALIGRWMHSAGAGLIAGAVLASAPLFLVSAKVCLPDAPLLLCLLVAIHSLARQFRSEPGLPTAIVFWLAVGLGLLTKGPVCLLYAFSPLVGTSVLGGPELRRRSLAALFPSKAAVVGPLLSVAIVSAWLIPVQIRTEGAFLESALGVHVWDRAIRPMEGHTAPPGFFLVLLLATFFPWSLIAPRAVAALVRSPKTDTPEADRWVRPFLLGWLVLPWLVLEVHATKLPHYILPTAPALALAVAGSLRSERFATRTLIAFVVVLSIAGMSAIALLASDHDPPLPARALETWNALRPVEPFAVRGAGVGALLAISAALLAHRFRADATRCAIATAMTVALPAITTTVLVLPGLTALRTGARVAESIKRLAPTGPVLLLGLRDDPQRLGYDEPSLVLHLGGRARIAASAEHAAELMRVGPEPPVFVVDERLVPMLRARLPGLGEPTVVVYGFNFARGRPVRLGVFMVANEGEPKR